MDERFALRSTVDVLRIRLRELLREDKGGVYGVSVQGELVREPKEAYSTAVSFTCSPANVPDLIQATLDEIQRVQTGGPGTDALEKVRETHLRNYEKGLKEDNFWLGNLDFYRQNDLPFGGILRFPERARALTAETIQEAARKYFSSENRLIARLIPEANGAPAEKRND